MAKGRKLTTSRSELLLGSYGYGGPTTVQRDDVVELEEDDVWSMVDGMVNRTRAAATVEVNPRGRYRSSVRRGGDGGGGGLSSAFEDGPPPGKMVTSSQRIVHQFVGGAGLESPRGQRHVATSAPVNVPDWSKIYHRVDSVESLRDDSDDVMINDHDSDMVPPHEYLAQSRDSGSNSIFVGVGRTLKGRDLSRVRDAVWSRTGFNG